MLLNKEVSPVIVCSDCWHFGMNSAYISKCIVVLAKSPLSSSELHTLLLTWWDSWRGWRCRRGCHGYAPSGCSLCCPSSRSSCQEKTRNNREKRHVRSRTWPGVKQHFSSSVCHQYGRQKASNLRYTNKQAVVSFWWRYEPPDAVQTGDASHLFLTIQYFFPLVLTP